MTSTESSATESLPGKLRWALSLCLISYTALLLSFIVYNLTDDDGSFSLWLAQCLPLLMFLPGILRTSSDRGWRTYSWLCFVVLVYFTHAVVNVMSPLVNWKDIAQLGLSVCLFISAMMTSRWLQRHPIAQADAAN